MSAISEDAVVLTVSVRPESAELERLVQKAVEEATAKMRAELEALAASSASAGGGRGGGGGGGRGRGQRRRPGPHTEYAGPPPTGRPHGTLPRQGPATGPGRDWTQGEPGPGWGQDAEGGEGEEDDGADGEPGRAYFDEEEGRWVYPDDPVLGYRPSRKGMAAEPAKGYIEHVESRYQPAVGRPPFESPWLSREQRPYLPGEASVVSPRGFQQEKVNRRGGVRWSQAMREARIRGFVEQEGMDPTNAFLRAKAEQEGRAGGLYSGIGPTAGINPRGVMERLRELERYQREMEADQRREERENREEERRQIEGVREAGAAYSEPITRAIEGVRSFQGLGGGGVLAAEAKEAVTGMAMPGIIRALGGAGPHAAALTGAISAGPAARALFDSILQFMSQKGLPANHDWLYLLENQQNALFTHTETKKRLLGIDAYVVTETDRYVPGSGATTFNSLQGRGELIESNIGLAELAVGVEYNDGS